MQEEWRRIGQFPGYSVSNLGSIRNDQTDRLMSQCVNNRGISTVGLVKSKTQYRRSVPLLVAQAFIPRSKTEQEFDTPINLDGDRRNNAVSNLLWRPRYFALRYIAQFQQDAPCFSRPVEIIETGEQFNTSWEAATSLGVLDREIAISVMTKNFVWPIFKHFRLVMDLGGLT